MEGNEHVCPWCGHPLVEDEVELGGYRTRMVVCTNPDCDYYDYEIPEELSEEEAAEWVDEVHYKTGALAKIILLKHGYWHVDIIISRDWASRKIHLSPETAEALRKLAAAFGKAGVLITAKRKKGGIDITIRNVRPEFIGYIKGTYELFRDAVRALREDMPRDVPGIKVTLM